MRTAILSGDGNAGWRIADALRRQGHTVHLASRATGFDLRSGAGLVEALAGADIVVDATAPRSRIDLAGNLRDCHEAASRRFAHAAREAGVGHVVVLSALGADRMALTDFFLAKIAQESLVRTSGLPYTILRTPPLYEQLYRIIDAETDSAGTIRIPPITLQPAAAADMVALVAEVVMSAPLNDVVEVGGPELLDLPELIRAMLAANEDPRDPLVEDEALYFGMPVGREPIMPRSRATFTRTRFGDWLRNTIAQA